MVHFPRPPRVLILLSHHATFSSKNLSQENFQAWTKSIIIKGTRIAIQVDVMIIWQPDRMGEKDNWIGDDKEREREW